MAKYENLRLCFRKPCQWREHCRNVHAPYGKHVHHNKIYNDNDTNVHNFSRIREGSSKPASHHHTSAKSQATYSNKDIKEDTNKNKAAHTTQEKERLAFPSSNQEKGPLQDSLIIGGNQGGYGLSNGEPTEKQEQENPQGQEMTACTSRDRADPSARSWN
jgi:hypothetical protein